MNIPRPLDAPKFAYNGGKANLRTFISYFFPREGTHYVEPFAGRFNVFFLQKVIGKYQNFHLNDIRTKVLFDAISNYSGQDIPDVPPGTLISDLEKNVHPVVFRLLEPLLCWAGGDYSTTTKALPVPGRNFAQYKTNILRAQLLLEGVLFTELDAIEVIDYYGQYETPVLYVDPPYLGANVSAYSDKDVDYERMLRSLTRCKCRWVMSEYQNELADSYIGQPKACYYTKVNTQGKTAKTKDVVEVLYSNFELGAPKVIDFGNKVKSPYSSRRCFSAGQCMTRQEAYAVWTSHYPNWAPENHRIEFSILLQDPFIYWDGKNITFLPGFDRK